MLPRKPQSLWFRSCLCPTNPPRMIYEAIQALFIYFWSHSYYLKLNCTLGKERGKKERGKKERGKKERGKKESGKKERGKKGERKKKASGRTDGTDSMKGTTAFQGPKHQWHKKQRELKQLCWARGRQTAGTAQIWAFRFCFNTHNSKRETKEQQWEESSGSPLCSGTVSTSPEVSVKLVFLTHAIPSPPDAHVFIVIISPAHFPRASPLHQASALGAEHEWCECQAVRLQGLPLPNAVPLHTCC